MSDYQDSFEKLASRGTPLGAIALLEDVEAQNHRPAIDAPTPGRRLRGLALAAIAFVAVLAGGLVLGWFRAPLDFVTTSESVIAWTETSEPGAIYGGPGGTIQVTYSTSTPSLPIVEFSSNGRNWVPTEGLTFDTPLGVRDVVTTRDTWLLLATDNSSVVARSSSDGISWTEVFFPDPLVDALSSIAGSPGGFMATAYDVFGVGSTVWWSVDGKDWTEVTDTFPGDPRGGSQLNSSAGGIVWRPAFWSRDSFPVTIHISEDGTNWTETQISSPPETGLGSMVSLQLVDFVGDQWITIGQVFQVDADPGLVVWTSPDGLEWNSQGVPPFGHESGSAVAISWAYSLVDNALIVAPWTIPVTGEGGEIRHMNGSSSGTGELWMTTDGRTWHREVTISGEIASFGVWKTADGSLAGTWTTAPEPEPDTDVSGDTSVSPVTTQFRPAPEDLDPAGQALQDAILADGYVTREEFEQALEGWKRCMQNFGYEQADYEISASGSMGLGWSSDPYAGESENELCEANHVTRVHEGVSRNLENG